MDCIAETASFSSLTWRPCACLHMRSLAISLKNRLAIQRFVFTKCIMFVWLIYLVEGCPVYVYASVIAGFNVFCY